MECRRAAISHVVVSSVARISHELLNSSMQEPRMVLYGSFLYDSSPVVGGGRLSPSWFVNGVWLFGWLVVWFVVGGGRLCPS